MSLVVVPPLPVKQRTTPTVVDVSTRSKAKSRSKKPRRAQMVKMLPNVNTTRTIAPASIATTISKRPVANDFRMRHSEMCFNVVSSAVTDQIQAFSINPANGSLFPYLSGIANKFDSYRFNKLSFRYVPEVGSGSTGHCCAAVDPDPDKEYDDLPHSRQEMMSFETAVSSNLWLGWNLDVPMSSISRYPKYLVATQDTARDTGEPARDVGRLFMTTYSSGSSVVGTFWVTYDITLFNPGVNRIPLVSYWTEALPADAGQLVLPSGVNHYVALTDLLPYVEKALYSTPSPTGLWTLFGDKFSVGMAVVAGIVQVASGFGKLMTYLPHSQYVPPTANGLPIDFNLKEFRRVAGAVDAIATGGCPAAPLTTYDRYGFTFSRAGRYRLSFKLCCRSTASDTFSGWSVLFYPHVETNGAFSSSYPPWITKVYDTPGAGSTVANANMSMSVSDRILWADDCQYFNIGKDIEFEVTSTGPDYVFSPGVKLQFVQTAAGNTHVLAKSNISTTAPDMASHFTITYLGDSSDD